MSTNESGYGPSLKNNPEKEIIYFANKPAKQAAGILLDKGASFFNMLRSNAYLEKLNRMWRFYHGAYNNDLGYGHRVDFTGDQGELVQIPINHFRNIAQHILSIITSSRPAMDCRAVNTDYKSLAQTYIGNGILDYYMREKHLEEALKKAVELAVVLGAGYIKMEWNATAGETYEIDPDTGEQINEGEVEFSNLTPLDVIVDGTKETWDNDWIMTRTFKNRFDLMAKYPEYADRIRGLPSKSDSAIYRLAVWSNDDTDDIPVYEFYHKRSDAVPEGRYLLFLDADVILIDTKLPYRQIPIFRIVPAEVLGTPYGYSPMFDIYPIQEGINSLYSTIMTNQNAFGVQNVFVKRGSDINFNSIEGAMNIIEANEKPEALQLTQTPKEVFDFLNELIKAAETVSGINSVTRGNPEASLKSGTALALVQSQSLQFVSNLQQNYVKLIEDVGTALINILKDFATAPKVIALVGKNNRTFLKEFTGDQIKDINRVIVDMGNPLSKCLAKDTPVLMFDGTTKMAQDIQVDDWLMGPDSYPRTVTNINSGIEMMYEITSKDKNRNIKYGCNESHILTLRYCSDDYRYDVKKDDILDISVKEYLKLPERHKRLLQGFTVEVEYEEKNLEIPPYILGSWLGDGTSRNTSITSMDLELVNEWRNYSDSIGMNFRIQENKNTGKAKTYFITSGSQGGKTDRNPFMNSLHNMELIQNKHIPFCYLTSSRKQRLELLAGLLDTDGYRIDETFIFTQKNDKLSSEVVQLAKSLGFRVTYKKELVKPSKLIPYLSENYYVNKISIGGNTWEIPTRIPRKKAKQKEKSRNPLNYGINVECKGEGTYYGFTLREEAHFVLGDFTISHNTIAGRVQMAEQMMQMKLITDPNQYFQVINTGRLDSMFEGTMSEILLIKAENEKMLNGESPLVSPTDKHSEHITEHKAILADPDTRQDGELVKIVMDHLQQHMDALRSTDPDLLKLCGENPLPPIQASGGNPQGPSPGSNLPPPQQGAPNGQNVPKSALNKSPNGPIQAAPQGMAQPGEAINNGPGIAPGARMPGLPKVAGSLLPNVALQEAVLGNVNPRK